MKQIVQDQLWANRIDSMNKYYQEWETRFKCEALEKYYEGLQWAYQQDLSNNPYVINKIYETVQIKIAQFVPSFPKFNVSAKPGNQEFNLETAMRSAQLKEDVLNTITSDDRNNFSEEIEQAYKDSFFRFGIMEVGYAADWINNPNVKKPLLEKDVNARATGKNRSKMLDSLPEIPINERIYFKHIPAKRFRVGGIDHKYLTRCSYVGYYDYVYMDDLLSMKLINRDKLTNGVIEPGSFSTSDKEDHNYRQDGVIKIWHMWDLRSMMQLLIVDSPCVTVSQRPFQRLPLKDFRPDKRLIGEGFYPVPPVYHWLSPQDEINETREQLRNHRRKFIRKFQIVEGAVTDEEIEKFESTIDGALIKVARENAITPIQNADLGNSLPEAIQTSGDDLNRISGTSNESRGIADRTTATQAQIINQRSGIRETKDRDRVVTWLSEIGREVLSTVKDKFTLGIWAELTSPEGENFLGEIQEVTNAARWISAEELHDGYDFKINVEVTSLSVVAREDEKKSYLEFLSTLTNFPMIAFSPLLVRETANRVGYRNDRAIKELQKMALLMEMGRMNQLQMQAGLMPGDQNAAQGIVAQQTPNTQEQITNQIQGQLTQ